MEWQWSARAPQCIRAHPLATVLLLALAVRLVLMPLLAYDFDLYHWGVIIQNIESGNGLYDVAGYYYTPAWGYIMGLLTGIMELFGGPDVFGTRFTELLPVEDLVCRFHVATVTTIDFNLFMKTFFVIVDFAVAALLYRFVEERTSDARRAVMAAAIWLFCIPVVYMSAIQGMFDNVSAFLMLLTVYLLYRDRAFVAGMVFGCSVLLKFFPAFTILVLVGYLWAKHRDDGLAVRRIAEAAVGAVIVVGVLYMPQILDGTFTDSLSFVFGRVGNTTPLQHAFSYVQMFVMVAGMIVTGVLMFRTREDVDRRFVEYTTMALVFAVLLSNTPQYMIVFVPLMAVMIVSGRREYLMPLTVAALGSFMNAIVINNFSLLLSLSEYTSLVSPDWVLSAMQGLESVVLLGQTSVSLFCGVGGFIEFIGLLLMLMIYFRRPIGRAMPRLGRLIDRISHTGGAGSEREALRPAADSGGPDHSRRPRGRRGRGLHVRLHRLLRGRVDRRGHGVLHGIGARLQGLRCRRLRQRLPLGRGPPLRLSRRVLCVGLQRRGGRRGREGARPVVLCGADRPHAEVPRDRGRQDHGRRRPEGCAPERRLRRHVLVRRAPRPLRRVPGDRLHRPCRRSRPPVDLRRREPVLAREPDRERVRHQGRARPGGRLPAADLRGGVPEHRRYGEGLLRGGQRLLPRPLDNEQQRQVRRRLLQDSGPRGPPDRIPGGRIRVHSDGPVRLRNDLRGRRGLLEHAAQRPGAGHRVRHRSGVEDRRPGVRDRIGHGARHPGGPRGIDRPERVHLPRRVLPRVLQGVLPPRVPTCASAGSWRPSSYWGSPSGSSWRRSSPTPTISTAGR